MISLPKDCNNKIIWKGDIILYQPNNHQSLCYPFCFYYVREVGRLETHSKKDMFELRVIDADNKINTIWQNGIFMCKRIRYKEEITEFLFDPRYDKMKSAFLQIQKFKEKYENNKT